MGVDSPGGWTAVLAQYESTMSGRIARQTLSQEERDHAVADLEASLDVFLEATVGLTLAQWRFKPAPDRWSATECTEHIAVIEGLSLRLITGQALLAPAEPERRKSIKYSDQEIVRIGNERSTKLRAPESVHPSGRWATPDDTVHNLQSCRARTIEFVKITQEDLRNHFLEHPVFKTLDIYQWVLLVSAHMRRHTAQIVEVKADPDFPE